VKLKFAPVILLGLAAAGCASKTAVVRPPAAVPEYEALFAAGQAAFREATPEGYERAAGAFRKASSLRPERCEYSLHLAEALLFLALEEKLNQEDTAPAGQEAGRVIASVEARPCAAGFVSMLNRVKALSASPGTAEGLVWLVLWKLDAIDPRSPLLRANTLAPDLPVVQYEMGSANLILSHYPEARRNFERAIELSPRHFHSMIGLADAIGSADPESTQTLPLYQRASDVAPKYLEAHALLGYYYDQIEETDKALDQYRTIVALNPRNEPGQLSLGIALFKAGRPDDAEKTLHAALGLDAGDAQAHYYLASIGLNRGDFAGAQAEAELAVRYGRGFVEAFYLLGIILERESHIDEALSQYERALRIKKDYPDALLARGEIRAQRSQLADAVADFTAAVQAYRSQSAEFEKEAVKAETAGFLLKARAQRARKADAEAAMRRADEVRQRVQAAMKP
jgi:tetratricopeptide (TPR) repeat protein